MRWFSVEEALPLPWVPVLVWDQWDDAPDIAVLHVKKSHMNGTKIIKAVKWNPYHSCTYIDGDAEAVIEFGPSKTKWAHIPENPWPSQ